MSMLRINLIRSPILSRCQPGDICHCIWAWVLLQSIISSLCSTAHSLLWLSFVYIDFISGYRRLYPCQCYFRSMLLSRFKICKSMSISNASWTCLFVCFRYIWPLVVMQGICWLGRQLLVGGALICIFCMYKPLRCILSSRSISHQASRCGERCSSLSQGYFQTLSSWVSWSSRAGETFGQSVVYSSRSLKDSPVPRIY